jgi:hypothetical protein
MGGSDGNIIEWLEVVDDKTQNINRNGDIISISNILYLNHIINLYVEDVIYRVISTIILGADNGPNNIHACLLFKVEII